MYLSRAERHLDVRRDEHIPKWKAQSLTQSADTVTAQLEHKSSNSGIANASSDRYELEISDCFSQTGSMHSEVTVCQLHASMVSKII